LFTQRSAEVKKILGFPIDFDPEWPQLWSILQPHFSDTSTFVPHISEVIVAWCDAFLLWLKDDSNEEAVEQLLEEIKYERVPLYLEVGSTSMWQQ